MRERTVGTAIRSRGETAEEKATCGRKESAIGEATHGNRESSLGGLPSMAGGRVLLGMLPTVTERVLWEVPPAARGRGAVGDATHG